ncbi:hypothetical protein EIK77_003310 [Talaromyces pinophilus]|nr:hypothetical protein EIK77_003310 [Talaromyces pinophilus]
MDATSLSESGHNHYSEADSPNERALHRDHTNARARNDGEEIVIEDAQPSDAGSVVVDTPLHHAVRHEDYTIIKELLSKGEDINVRDTSGITVLHIALDQRNLGLLTTLLPFGPDLNLKQPNGMAPLHSTVSMNWEEGTRLLLGYDLDINATDYDGNTALHRACSAGNRDVTKLLLEFGADVQIRDSGGRTALQLAVASRVKRLPELLLLYGANIDDIGRRPEVVIVDGDQGVPNGDPGTDGNRKIEEDPSEATGESDLNSVLSQFSEDHWDGVHRDNGDGFILANYDNHDMFFDAKVEAIRLLMHEGQEMHAIQLKLNFMKPFSAKNRIRYAKVDAKLAVLDTGNKPHIHSIMPQADRVQVSEQEISSGQTLTVGATGGGGPSNVNISMEGSKSRKSTFKGVRIIHGVVKDRMHASWRMYEEPGSQSGLPEIVRLLLLVQCKAEFIIRLSMSVKACHFSSFGIPRTLVAKSGPAYRVPDVTTMLKLERAMKLKNILNVANRAATSVEEARILEREFARSIQKHAKKALIMEAGSRDGLVREWNNIADASREGDFSMLHDKLMKMDVAEYRQRLAEVISMEPESRSGRIIGEPPYRQNRTPYFRRRSTTDSEDEEKFGLRYDRETGRRMAVDFLSRERPYNSQAKNAMESFSAVGPGYKVSRMA